MTTTPHSEAANEYSAIYAIGGEQQRPANGLTRLLVRLGGSVVTPDMSSTDRRLHLATGISMLATGLIAMIGGYVLATSSLRLGHASLIVGLLYAVLIITLDRFFIVTSQHLNGRRRVFAVLFRIVIAVSAGYIVAEPIIIDIYGSEVQQQVQMDNEKAWLKERGPLQHTIDESQKRLMTAEQGVAVPPGLQATTQYQVWLQDTAIYRAWEKKIAPEASGSAPDHKFGCGPVCHLDETETAAAEAQVKSDYVALQVEAKSIWLDDRVSEVADSTAEECQRKGRIELWPN